MKLFPEWESSSLKSSLQKVKHREPEDERIRPAPELEDSALARSSAIADLPIVIADHASLRTSAPTSSHDTFQTVETVLPPTASPVT